MPTSAVKLDPAAPRLVAGNVSAPAKPQKLQALLVTSDDSLWAQVAVVGDQWSLRHVDSADDLIATTQAGETAVVLWDARGHDSAAAELSRIQMHSDRYVVVVLDDCQDSADWQVLLARRQVAAHLSLPLAGEDLSAALESAREEVNSRLALLGSGASSTEPLPPSRAAAPKLVALFVCLIAVGAVLYLLGRHKESVVATNRPVEDSAPRRVEGERVIASTDEKVDLLIEQAQKAMMDRHYLEPAEGSALTLYRSALVLDASRGEAAQGLQRLAEILVAKVQSALDERKYDIALQTLESARSINAADPRLTAFDERLATLKAELGPAQIQAALNAQNFDRASQLLDEAAKEKVLTGAKVTQLREELHRRREQADLSRLVALIGARLQQDRLIDPRNDNVAFYLAEARQIGANSAQLQAQNQDFIKRSLQAARTAIDQLRYGDADRFLIELRNCGAAGPVIAALQHDVTAARASPTHEKSAQSQFLDLARTRLSQGNITEPENDSALYYLHQLRSIDPLYAGLAPLESAVQQKLFERSTEALDTGDVARAEALMRQLKSLGNSSAFNTLNERLTAAKLKSEAGARASAGNLMEVGEESLIRLKPLKPTYPVWAFKKDIQGWVEIGYTVTSKGQVADIKVRNAEPAGVFDAAAKEAVARVAYKPTVVDGTPIAVTTQLRIVFRLHVQ